MEDYWDFKRDPVHLGTWMKYCCIDWLRQISQVEGSLELRSGKVKEGQIDENPSSVNRRSVMSGWLGASNFLMWEMTFFIDQIGTGIALDEERRYLWGPFFAEELHLRLAVLMLTHFKAML